MKKKTPDFFAMAGSLKTKKKFDIAAHKESAKRLVTKRYIKIKEVLPNDRDIDKFPEVTRVEPK